jgi:hypothetical protein
MVLSSHGTLEYVEESAFATFPTNPAMLWIGIVQKAVIASRHKNQDYRGLKAAAATNQLQIAGNIKTGNDLELSLEYQPQNWTFFKYAMALNAGATLTDTLDSLSFGAVSIDATPKYLKMEGGKIDKIEVSIAEDSIAKVTAKIPFADIYLATNDPWTTTYLGSGSAAADPGTAPLGYNDITTLTLGGAAFNATDIKFGINNNLKAIKDPSNTNLTNIVDLVPQKREITFSCKARRSAMNDFAVKHFGYGANNIILTISGTTFTFTGAKIPEEVYSLMDEGVAEMDVNFTSITNLAIT